MLGPPPKKKIFFDIDITQKGGLICPPWFYCPIGYPCSIQLCFCLFSLSVSRSSAMLRRITRNAHKAIKPSASFLVSLSIDHFLSFLLKAYKAAFLHRDAKWFLAWLSFWKHLLCNVCRNFNTVNKVNNFH